MSTSALIMAGETAIRVNWDGYPSEMVPWIRAQANPFQKVQKMFEQSGWDWRSVGVDGEEVYSDSSKTPLSLSASGDPLILQLAVNADYFYKIFENGSFEVYRGRNKLSESDLTY